MHQVAGSIIIPDLELFQERDREAPRRGQGDTVDEHGQAISAPGDVSHAQCRGIARNYHGMFELVCSSWRSSIWLYSAYFWLVLAPYNSSYIPRLFEPLAHKSEHASLNMLSVPYLKCALPLTVSWYVICRGQFLYIKGHT